jgi:hypothetical protein
MISTTPRSPRPERNDPSLQDHRGGSVRDIEIAVLRHQLMVTWSASTRRLRRVTDFAAPARATVKSGPEQGHRRWQLWFSARDRLPGAKRQWAVLGPGTNGAP